MTCNEKKDAAFAYESSVHSKNLLLRLNAQREQGLLCDVTVVVEDQRFQAHRAVLAACSEYFLSRVVPPCDGDSIVTLPEEVTVKGFAPLLEFAYTSRLLVNKDNLSEVRKCATILEIHDIEETCFHFLKLKYLDNKPETQDCPRKKCCKSFCPKANVQCEQDYVVGLEIDEVEELWKEEFPQSLKCTTEIENLSRATESPKRPCETSCFAKDNSQGFSSLCPKYRKFQKACRVGRVRSVSTCSGSQEAQSPSSSVSTEISENVTLPKPQENASDQLDNKNESPLVDMERYEINPPDSNITYHNLTYAEEKTSAKLVFPPCFSLEPRNFNSVPFQCTYEPLRNLNYIDMHNDSNTPLPPENVGTEESANRIGEFSGPKQVSEPDVCVPGESLLTRERSIEEREVAEHLAKGFWPDIYGTELTCPPGIELMPAKEPAVQPNAEKRSECPWLGISISESPERTFTTLSSVACPFISTLSSEGSANNLETNNEECLQGKQPEKCPYACSVSVEGDSETDSEGDSGESLSARERECEKKLPFSAQKIISLSRYDFQSLVKMHNLTAEQLDFIHDIRRRSKNRIAAQRCRKRKLDCIQNLETEIQKLEDEKEHLLKERDQLLSTLGETKQNLSGLCQQVCLEAALSREQIQILAKYSSSECPLSFLTSEKDKLLLQCPSMLQTCQQFTEGSPGVASQHDRGGSNKILPSMGPMQNVSPQEELLEKPRSQSGITDFCQQMTDKCTTDELH
ncbi:transcription regulator protein BACH1 [Spea bombifrons]|uniref:transcription regulator protein BACH1 n=1 Tax=Spea bombifrons TaxID=233779 RepID=UPI00234B6ABA|nr:transcription regulator protein BACH1 [Spea bombifrons]XP_053312772.1 transcription regulator protein BACH1 [Spea bombifrons]